MSFYILDIHRFYSVAIVNEQLLLHSKKWYSFYLAFIKIVCTIFFPPCSKFIFILKDEFNVQRIVFEFFVQSENSFDLFGFEIFFYRVYFFLFGFLSGKH